MKTGNVIVIITVIFLLAAGVVWYVLQKTDETLKDAQKAADKAKGVTDNAKDIISNAGQTWDSFKKLWEGL